jgi:hypothetical protein
MWECVIEEKSDQILVGKPVHNIHTLSRISYAFIIIIIIIIYIYIFLKQNSAFLKFRLEVFDVSLHFVRKLSGLMSLFTFINSFI